MRVDVVAAAGLVAPDLVRGATVLVVDVLRASTTIIAALAAGCEAVVPVTDADEAWRRARAHGRDAALVAGEREGRTIAGFDLGNSPLEVSEERVRGRTLYFTTSNGTRALLAARPAGAVGVAALVNARAAAGWARGQGRDVVVVCAGTGDARALEDWVCAGVLVERLGENGGRLVPSATAQEALASARGYAGALARLATDAPWARHLAAAGHGGDIAACLVLDTTDLVPVYVPAVDKIVTGCR